MRCRIFRVIRFAIYFWGECNRSIERAYRVIAECEGRYFYPSWRGWEYIRDEIGIRVSSVPSFADGGIEIEIPDEIFQRYFYPIEGISVSCDIRRYGFECYYCGSSFSIRIPERVREFIERGMGDRVSISGWIRDFEERSPYGERIRRRDIFIPVPF